MELKFDVSPEAPHFWPQLCNQLKGQEVLPLLNEVGNKLQYLLSEKGKWSKMTPVKTSQAEASKNNLLNNDGDPQAETKLAKNEAEELTNAGPNVSNLLSYQLVDGARGILHQYSFSPKQHREWDAERNRFNREEEKTQLDLTELAVAALVLSVLPPMDGTQLHSKFSPEVVKALKKLKRRQNQSAQHCAELALARLEAEPSGYLK